MSAALQVFQGIVPAERIRNKIVIIGVTALGLADVVSTPVAARMDGVEVQAQTLENILSETLRPAAVTGHPGWNYSSFCCPRCY